MASPAPSLNRRRWRPARLLRGVRNGPKQTTMGKRLLWFVALYAASVVVVLAVAYGLRFVLLR